MYELRPINDELWRNILSAHLFVVCLDDSNNRLGAAYSEWSEVTCFAKEKSDMVPWRVDRRSMPVALRHTCRAERESWKRGKKVEGRRVQTQNTKKKPSWTHEFESTRVRVRASKLQRMQWSDT